MPNNLSNIQFMKDVAKEFLEGLRTISADVCGVTRLAYSPKETESLAYLQSCADKYGLMCDTDEGGNLVVTLEGSDKKAPFVATGSHIDSVVQGGNFDGAAGIAAGLAVLAGLAAEGVTPGRTMKLYALRGEESARFGKAYMGSLSLLGGLSPLDLQLKDSAGITMEKAMRSCGVNVDKITSGTPLADKNDFYSWVELHIEQGPVLETKGMPVGIVTGIRGNIRHMDIKCRGAAGHSGAVPRALRQDTVFAVSELIYKLDLIWEELEKNGADIVVTTGILCTDPAEHAVTRIPGSIRFSLDIRSECVETMNLFYMLFEQECVKIAEKRGVVFELGRKIVTPPAVLSGKLIELLENSASGSVLKMASGAGHDAAVFANSGVASAMIFVRNAHGSHNPEESMELDDFMAGVKILCNTLLELANE